jgi:hypothetical protein
MPAPPVSPVRTTLIDSAGAILEKNLRGAGWEAELTDPSKRGQTAANPDEEWDENTAWVTFTARRPGGGPTLLTPDEATAVVKGVRADVRRLVLNAGGEVIETTEGEAYREKSVTVTYKIDKVAGSAQVKIGPASDRAEETANRMEVVVREQPVK